MLLGCSFTVTLTLPCWWDRAAPHEYPAPPSLSRSLSVAPFFRMYADVRNSGDDATQRRASVDGGIVHHLKPQPHYLRGGRSRSNLCGWYHGQNKEANPNRLRYDSIFLQQPRVARARYNTRARVHACTHADADADATIDTQAQTLDRL